MGTSGSRRSPMLLETGANFGPRRLEKGFRPALRARLVEVISVFGLQTLQKSRRHQAGAQTLGDRIRFSDFRVDRGHHGQNDAFTLSKPLEEVYCGGCVSVNDALVDALVVGNRLDVARGPHVVRPRFARAISLNVRSAQPAKRFADPLVNRLPETLPFVSIFRLRIAPDGLDRLCF